MTITTGGTQTASLSAEGNFRFATNIVDSSVSIIDVESQEVVRTVPVGDRPNGVVYGGSDL